MKTYITIAKKDPYSKEIEAQIIRRMEREHWHQEKTHPDFIFAIGGDGTFLHAVHCYMDQLETALLIGIHTGTLGFFTDYKGEEIDELFASFFTRPPQIHEYRMLETAINKEVFFSLNETRVENVYKTQIIDVYLDDVKLERFRGTGLCVCTQPGSTAYNRSLKGAVIQNGLELLELCEITGIHHKEYQSLGSSLILHPDTEIKLLSSSFDGAVLCYDQHSFDLKNVTEIKISLSNKKVRIARYRTYDYTLHLKNLF